jgi:hypothetical protein
MTPRHGGRWGVRIGRRSLARPSPRSSKNAGAPANAICAATHDAVDAELEKFFTTAFADLPEGADTPEEAQKVNEAMDAMFDEAITARFEEQIAEPRALGAPEGDAEALTALYDDFDNALDDYDSTPDDAVAGDEEAMEWHRERVCWSSLRRRQPTRPRLRTHRMRRAGRMTRDTLMPR